MKKMFLAVVAVLLFNASLFAAAEGKIVSVRLSPSGTSVSVQKVDTSIVTSWVVAADLKTFTAIALTAKSAGSDVRLDWNGGWVAIEIK